MSTFISQNFMSADICMLGETQSFGMPALVGFSYYALFYFSFSFTYLVAILNKVIFIYESLNHQTNNQKINRQTTYLAQAIYYKNHQYNRLEV